MCIVYSLWNSFVKWFTQPPFFSFRWLGFRQLFIKLEGTNQSSLKVCDIKNESINLPICHEGVLVSRNCTCTLCKTGQKQNKLEKQDLKQEKKNSSWQRTAYWMYKDRRIVPLHENSPVPVVAWVRFSDPHNIKVTWRLCETLLSVHFPATGFLFFFFFRFFGFVHWLLKQTLQLQIWVGNTGQRATHGSANAKISIIFYFNLVLFNWRGRGSEKSVTVSPLSWTQRWSWSSSDGAE